MPGNDLRRNHEIVAKWINDCENGAGQDPNSTVGMTTQKMSGDVPPWARTPARGRFRCRSSLGRKAEADRAMSGAFVDAHDLEDLVRSCEPLSDARPSPEFCLRADRGGRRPC